MSDSDLAVIPNCCHNWYLQMNASDLVLTVYLPVMISHFWGRKSVAKLPLKMQAHLVCICIYLYTSVYICIRSYVLTTLPPSKTMIKKSKVTAASWSKVC